MVVISHQVASVGHLGVPIQAEDNGCVCLQVKNTLTAHLTYGPDQGY